MTAWVSNDPLLGRTGDAGYLLIELAAALALAGLIVALALPSLPAGTTPVRFHALLANTAALLRATRTRAIAEATATHVRFDRRARTLRAGARMVAIPADVKFEMIAGCNSFAAPDAADIFFQADGSSCGGTLRFARQGRAFRVEVNGLTGHVAILDGR
jgi:general secretion pathway protein H